MTRIIKSAVILIISFLGFNQAMGAFLENYILVCINRTSIFASLLLLAVIQIIVTETGEYLEKNGKKIISKIIS